MAKPFTLEQIEQLRKNPYTYKVTDRKIFFTAEFKKAFYQKRQEGLTLKESFISLGYDPEVLGDKRIDGISQCVQADALDNGWKPHPGRNNQTTRPWQCH